MTVTLVLQKGFTPKNIYVKYESSITYHSKAIASVKKVFVDKQMDRPKTICPQSINAISSEGKVTHTF